MPSLYLIKNYNNVFGTLSKSGVPIPEYKISQTKFLSNIEPVKHIINPIKMKSVDAAKLYDDSSLDLVFIDAGHEFEHVVDDIKAWLPKIRPYGIIAGHDYTWDPEVQRAVHSIFPTISAETEGCWIKINDGE